MATTTEETHASRFWHLKEDDQRTLFIVFVGGLAANIGVVLIVGLGLGLDRWMRTHHFRDWLLAVLIVVVGMAVLYLAVPTVRLGAAIAVLLMGAIILVGLVGYAAGLK